MNGQLTPPRGWPDRAVGGAEESVAMLEAKAQSFATCGAPERGGGVAPEKEKARRMGGLELAAGSCERIGRRATMEDAVCLVPSLERADAFEVEEEPLKSLQDGARKDGGSGGGGAMGVFGVFDGHGGRESAAFCSKVVPWLFARKQEAGAGDVEQALRDSFQECDELLRNHLQVHFSDSKEFSSGCTGVVVAVEKATAGAGGRVVCANLGDSRALLVRSDGTSVELSQDHVPSLERERERIENAGGFIKAPLHNAKCLRVLGSLAVTRSFGDFDFKMPKVAAWGTTASPITADLVTNLAEVKTEVQDGQALAVVLACDGIWNVFTSEEAGLFIASKLKKLDDIMKKESDKVKSEVLAEALVDAALDRMTTDNCSVVVVLLRSPPVKSSLCLVS